MPADRSHDIEYSEDLVEWIVIARDVSGNYIDTGSTRISNPSGYYRAVSK